MSPINLSNDLSCLTNTTSFFAKKEVMASAFVIEGIVAVVGACFFFQLLPGVNSLCGGMMAGAGIVAFVITISLASAGKSNAANPDINDEPSRLQEKLATKTEVCRQPRLQTPLKQVDARGIRFESLVKEKPELARAFNGSHQLPFITQYGLGGWGPSYCSLAVRLPHSCFSNLPLWVKSQVESGEAELYFLLINETKAIQGSKRNLRMHYMAFPNYDISNPTWRETNIGVALSEPDGILPTEEIPLNSFSQNNVILHGPGLQFSPDNMSFGLAGQGICQGYFTTQFYGKTVIFHTVIVRSQAFPTEEGRELLQAVDTAASTEEFVSNVSKSSCSKKESILRTFRGMFPS